MVANVHPDCINASNPYHECSNYCFQRISERKSVSGTQKPSAEGESQSLSGPWLQSFQVPSEGKKRPTPLNSRLRLVHACVVHAATDDAQWGACLRRILKRNRHRFGPLSLARVQPLRIYQRSSEGHRSRSGRMLMRRTPRPAPEL